MPLSVKIAMVWVGILVFAIVAFLIYSLGWILLWVFLVFLGILGTVAAITLLADYFEDRF